MAGNPNQGYGTIATGSNIIMGYDARIIQSNLHAAGIINLTGSSPEFHQHDIATDHARGHHPSSSNSNNSVHYLCSKFLCQASPYQSLYYNHSTDWLEKLVAIYMDNNSSITTTEAIIWAISITFKDGKFYKMDEPVKYDLMIDLMKDSNKLFDCLPIKMGNIIFPLTENTAVLFDSLASTDDTYVSLMISIIMSSTDFKYNFRDNANFPFDMYDKNSHRGHYIEFTQNSLKTKYNGSITNYTFKHSRAYLSNINYSILVYHDETNFIEASKEDYLFKIKISPDCIDKLEDYFMHDINLEMYGHVESIINALKLRKEQHFKELQEEINAELDG